MKIKKIVAMALTFIMLMGVVPIGAINLATEASAKDISSYSVGDIITYGSYPQSKVTDSATISALNSLSKSWISYGYYSGSGEWDDGKMEPSDYMKYCDISYNGNKYRAVTFSSYRPYNTGYTSSTSNTYQDDNGYYTGNVYYFKYEPLKWRVLDPSEGFVMCTTAIDAQAYNNYVLYYSNGNSTSYDDYYGNSAKTYYASDWANSSIRAWLNNDFYNTAFTSTEKSQIGTTYNENKSTYSSQYDSANTNDKIFLLSYNEVLNTKYGFSSSYSAYDTARQLKSTDYAKCQGCYQNTSTSYYGNSWWRLRSPFISYSAANVYSDGDASSGSYGVISALYGVVPAFKFNPKSTIQESYDNTVYTNKKVTFTIEGAPGETNLTFDPAWFAADSKNYNHSMAQLASQFAMIGYCDKSEDKKRKPELENALSKIGFNEYEIEPNAGRDGVNYFIASKQIKIDSTVYNIIFTGFIGSNGKQWNSNFDPYGKESSTNYADSKALKGKVHLGFNDAKNYVYDALTEYISKHGFEKSNTKILITGHSRGAATANLVAAKLIDEQTLAYPKNIYTFAFATPNSAVTEITDKKGNDYNRIFNIINPEDFVVKVLPTAWDFDKFGTTYVLPCKTNDYYSNDYTNAMQYKYINFNSELPTKYVNGDSVPNKVIKRLTSYVNNLDEFYGKSIRYSIISNEGMTPFEYFQYTLCPFVNKQSDTSDALTLALSLLAADPLQTMLYSRVTGFFVANGKLTDNFEDAHRAETYCAYMMSLTEKQIKEKRLSTMNTVNCPVDIEVYDKETGELVGRITDNVIDETIAAKANSVVMEVDGDSKMFYLPSNGDYEIKLTGNDTGTMDYTVATIDSDIGETERVNFYDVDITDGLTMTGEIENSDNFVLEEYTLECDNGETLEADEILGSDEQNTVAITTSKTGEGSGNVTESMNVTKGDYVTLTAEADESSTFSGWYIGSNKVSDESEYSFVAKENVIISAKFDKISSAKPELILSKTDVNVSVGEKVSVNVSTNITAGLHTAYGCDKIDNSIASIVENNGLIEIKGVSAGTAVLTVNLYNTDTNEIIDTKTITITVKNTGGVYSVSIDDVEVRYNNTERIMPEIEADSGVSYTVEYQSSDTSVASVDEYGFVFTWNRGNTVITCTVTDKNGNTVKDTCNVNVKFEWWQWLIWIFLLGFLWY